MKKANPEPFKLCVAIPYYGQASAVFFRKLGDLQRQPPCHLAMIDVIGDSLIPRARNTLTNRFLSGDCEALLFIDSDIYFHPSHIARIISHDLDAHPVIGGLYPKKKVATEWVINTWEQGPTKPGPDGLLPVQYIGTGFMLITRKVLEEIAEKWPHRAYSPDNDESPGQRFDYFPAGPKNLILPDLEGLAPGNERYLSEDWAFCEMARALGHTIVVDTQIRLEHFGSVAFPIHPLEAMSNEAKSDLEIGRRTKDYLSGNVQVFSTDDEGCSRRLIDVDKFVGTINPERFDQPITRNVA